MRFRLAGLFCWSMSKCGRQKQNGLECVLVS